MLTSQIGCISRLKRIANGPLVFGINEPGVFFYISLISGDVGENACEVFIGSVHSTMQGTLDGVLARISLLWRDSVRPRRIT